MLSVQPAQLPQQDPGIDDPVQGDAHGATLLHNAAEAGDEAEVGPGSFSRRKRGPATLLHVHRLGGATLI